MDGAMDSQQQQRCQRIGCGALFSLHTNSDDSCCYHPGPPVFHDGGKEWSCCKQRSHDFSLFLDIPGCTTGKHTSEKPQSVKAPTQKPLLMRVENPGCNDNRDACSRCRQGFFCSEHGPRSAVIASSKLESIETKHDTEVKDVESPKVIDLNAEQVCKGCKTTFTERDNHDTACNYHPGPPVFHDRSRGWTCCDVHVKEFDEFLTIPGCTRGWHKTS